MDASRQFWCLVLFVGTVAPPASTVLACPEATEIGLKAYAAHEVIQWLRLESLQLKNVYNVPAQVYGTRCVMLGSPGYDMMLE